MKHYDEIFRRRSFHIFRDAEPLTDGDIEKLEAFIKTVTPLYPDIKTETVIVPENETNCRRGGDRCILFYSEAKGDYLRNIGYIGEQIDLYLTSQNIGALWYGVGRPKEKTRNGLGFVIMIVAARVAEGAFRKDMFKAKRKPLCDIWSGETLGVGEIARFSPSAVNSQPWAVENAEGKLKVYRNNRPGVRGLLPVPLVSYFNRIDMGIFLCILETCLEREGYSFARELLSDTEDFKGEFVPAAIYAYSR